MFSLIKLAVLTLFLQKSTSSPALSTPLNTLVHTTTGPVLGTQVAADVLAWKGIPFAVPPIGARRWTAPTLNSWSHVFNATTLGPACTQLLNKSEAATDPSQVFYNTPPLPESEDCLSINVWAPVAQPHDTPKAVLFWIFGGGFQFGGSGTFFYDGASFAQNQDVILVSFNYRTNVFGFPSSPELPLQQENLALLDQQLALQWTIDNIAKFGGDPNKITLFGLSAGSASVALLFEKFPKNPPFHSVILQSGVNDALDSFEVSNHTAGFVAWEMLAEGLNCTAKGGDSQLECLRKVPTDVIEQFVLDNSLNFGPLSDNGVTIPNHPTEILKSGQFAHIPIMIGENSGGASFLTIGLDNFTDFISQPPFNTLPADQLRELYAVPELFPNDAEAIIALATDIQYQCPNSIFSNILAAQDQKIYRYIYGGVFPQFQFFPNAGSPEGVELPLVFGNLFDTTNTTEIALSKTLQTVWANFAKNPNEPPAPNWSAYTSSNQVIANLGFGPNVQLDNVVQLVNSSFVDRACGLIDTISE
ncbi:hypothetical protein Clacol_007911 [Clathrus columnatus]|uniref:Carboxylic ester hydrolase n=1 Tax=Clathrus columnatus TaxID=1419009 RepID=A0AAV5AL96_9AGAM|nr:hypothetical protein Clacol_007911 [Clathrus columnatus]